jgi:hypothetical protein
VVAARSSRREQQQQTQTALQELEIAVPKEQRPVNELAQLKEAWLYSWVRCQGRLAADRAGGVMATH